MRRVLLLLVVMAFVGAASATDYYVATWGNNTTQGNITHPWQNVSYATQQAVAGDTIYLFDGIWYGEHATFANSGNATHPITLTAYNGTPKLDGVDRTGSGINVGTNKDYIRISHLEVYNYYNAISIAHSSYCTVSNCEMYDTEGVVFFLSADNDTHNTIENCSLHDGGWNLLMIIGNHEPPGGNGIPATYLTVRNCTIYNNAIHGAIDFFGNLDYVEVVGCTFYSNWHGALFSHDKPDFMDHCMVHDCVFYGNDSGGITPIQHNNVYNSSVYNNTFYDYRNTVIYLSYQEPNPGAPSNFTANYNEFYNCATDSSTYCIRGNGDDSDGMVCDGNYVDAASGAFPYCFAYGTDGIVRNPLGSRRRAMVGSWSSARVEFDDNSVFTATFHEALESYTPIRYYPTNSSCFGKSGEYSGNINVAKRYNITLRPTYAYLYDVTVNHESSATDDRTNISAYSNVSTNPTWINATMQNDYSVYEIYKDDILSDTVTICADKTIAWNYSGEFTTSHDFKFERRYGLRSLYMNNSSPISITTSATENNMTFSRLPDRNDDEITSFKLVVKTS